MMKLVVMSVIVVICVIVAKVDCTAKTATPSIHSSRVVSTAHYLASSCAKIEEDIPPCPGPYADEESGEAYALQSTTATPYLQGTWFIGGARDDNRKSVTEGGSGLFGWWSRFVEGIKQNLGNKASEASEATTTAVRSDVSQQPETIVTYSFKGCSPTVMPFDLSFCSDLSPDAPQPAVSPTRVIYYVPALPQPDRDRPSDDSYEI